jgi:multicomponent Na+:H+ antiporter subunit F
MIGAFVVVGFIMLAIAVPYFRLVAVGPSVFDRLVALNALGTKVAVLTVLAGVAYGRLGLFVDLALGVVLLNIVTTLLVARHVRDRRQTGGGAS